jgi:hypothetical protein
MISNPLLNSVCVHNTFFQFQITHLILTYFWFLTILFSKMLQKINSVACSPQANYTDRSTAAGRRILVPTSADWRGCRVMSVEVSTAVNLGFLDRSRYFFIHVAPHLSSQGLSGPRSRPITSQKIW